MSAAVPTHARLKRSGTAGYSGPLAKKLGIKEASRVLLIDAPKECERLLEPLPAGVTREVALPLGFVDVKVCAVSDVWSGLKLVVRKELR
jgi:hypothetical protein